MLNIFKCVQSHQWRMLILRRLRSFPTLVGTVFMTSIKLRYDGFRCINTLSGIQITSVKSVFAISKGTFGLFYANSLTRHSKFYFLIESKPAILPVNFEYYSMLIFITCLQPSALKYKIVKCNYSSERKHLFILII